MAETRTVDGGYISLRLVARAAGISLAEMRRIAGELARGRRTDWLGGAVQVRTHNQGHVRHRDILLASLPEVLRAELASNRLRFLVAAEHPEPEADLNAADFRLLHRAAQSGIAADHFDVLIAYLCDGGPLARASRARFDLIMDRLFGHGFRDPVLIEVGADYRDFLDARRRQLGFDDAAFGTIVAEVGGAVHDGRAMPALLTGPGFLRVLMHIHALRALSVPELPRRVVVNRAIVGQIHAAVHALNLSYAEHRNALAAFGGGCLRTRDLGEREARRLLSHYIARGYVAPEPPLRAPAQPGYASQPQANLITKLLRQLGCADAAAMDAALRELTGGGDLASVTSAGAARMIDALLAPIIALRLSAARTWREMQAATSAGTIRE